MTREEAKAILENDIVDGHVEGNARFMDAFWMAVDALSQEPTNENLHREREQAYMQGYEDASKSFRQEPTEGDTSIEQALLLEVIDKCLPKPCDDAVSRDAVLDIICRETEWYDIRTQIEQLPSVTQKSGKWILLDECANSGYYCSNCQKKLVKEGWSQTVKKIKFCPNCGARMVEPQESEDKEW